MAFFNVRRADIEPDRRVARRQVVDCPGSFAMAGGVRLGRLVDLSEHGAKFETATAPSRATTGFLQWNGEDHYCTVIWSNANRCGFQFERAISTSVVNRTCSHIEVTLKTVAAVDRIQMGQRRGSLATEE